MAVTNRVSANEVMSDGDLAKQYQSDLNQLRHHLSRRESGEEQSAAVVSLKQQVENLLAESNCIDRALPCLIVCLSMLTQACLCLALRRSDGDCQAERQPREQSCRSQSLLRHESPMQSCMIGRLLGIIKVMNDNA